MRTRTLLPISLFALCLCLLQVSPLFAADSWDTLTIGTNQMKNVSVLQLTPVNIVFKHDSGYLNMKLQDLPDSLKKKYPYDPEKADAYQRERTRLQQIEAVTAREQQLRLAIQNSERKVEEANARLRALRGKPGNPDPGKMKNLRYEIETLETEKAGYQSQLAQLSASRQQLEGFAVSPVSPAQSSSDSSKKKKKKNK